MLLLWLTNRSYDRNDFSHSNIFFAMVQPYHCLTKQHLDWSIFFISVFIWLGAFFRFHRPSLFNRPSLSNSLHRNTAPPFAWMFLPYCVCVPASLQIIVFDDGFDNGFVFETERHNVDVNSLLWPIGTCYETVPPLGEWYHFEYARTWRQIWVF